MDAGGLGDAGGAGGTDGAVTSLPDAAGEGVGIADAALDQIVATNPTDTAFDVATDGSTSGATPDILSFTALPATISAGQSSTLSWTVTGATMLSLDQGAGTALVSVLGTTSQVVTPSKTTTYTLTLNASLTAQVTLTVVPLPSITSFVASPTVVSLGGSATLTAVFTGGTGMVDQGVGPVTSGGGSIGPIDAGLGDAGNDSGNGTSTGPINVATTYTLTVTNALGASATRQVTVEPVVFSPTGSMTIERTTHTATLLPSGTVLIAGGASNSVLTSNLASAELYDPAIGGFTATGNMTVARMNHTATLLGNGKVLIAGGRGGVSTGLLASAELYDPAAGTFTATGSMAVTRGGEYYTSEYTATLLPSGKVLIAGGLTSAASTELYDPAIGGFTATGNMTVARMNHTATLLGNGKVLIAGGGVVNDGTSNLASAELYDPAAGTFTATGAMTVARRNPTATLLPTGQVLIAGGFDSGGVPLDGAAELYDPAAGTFTATGSMTLGRGYNTATLLGNGKVLIAGGMGNFVTINNYDPAAASAELYDPAAGTFTALGTMNAARMCHTATLLPAGQVLMAGGIGGAPWSALASAELYP
jgi:hypothetical protein